MATKLVRNWAVTIAFSLGAVVASLGFTIFADAGSGVGQSQAAMTVVLAMLSGAAVDALRAIGYIVWHTKPSFRIKLHKIMRQHLA